MAYSFEEVLVYDANPGGVVKLLRNGTVTVKDPATGAVLTTVHSDGQGKASFMADLATVLLEAPNGFSREVTAQSSLAQNAADAEASRIAAQAARDQAVAAAQQTLPIVDNGDGTLTSSTPDSPVVDNGDGTLTYSNV